MLYSIIQRVYNVIFLYFDYSNTYNNFTTYKYLDIKNLFSTKIFSSEK